MNNYNTYILLDASRIDEAIDLAKELNPDFDSLYRGESQESLAEVAPYLFSFQQDTDFSKWYFENGWGNAWGILISSTASFEECHKHFRKFLLVKNEEGEELYFRFYDPRVLSIFLPTCDKQQIITFFGPVECFIIEDDFKRAFAFSHEKGELKQKEIATMEVCGEKLTI